MTEAWLEELDLPTCLRRLAENSVGRIAVIADDYPIVLPVNYRLVASSEANWLAVRTRPGSVLDRGRLPVAFEIDAIDPDHHQGWSVLVRGHLQRVDPDAADFRARFDPEPWFVSERDAWLVVVPFAITGRRLHAVESEWAFHPSAYL